MATTAKIITKLTPEQESKIPEFIARWINQVSVPTDREKAAKAVRDMYKAMDEDQPLVIFGQSPFSTAVMAAIFFELVKADKKKLHTQLGTQLGTQLYTQLYTQLHTQLHNQLGSQLHNQLRTQLHTQLHNQLGSQLHNQLHNQLGTQLHNQLHTQLHSQLHNQLGTQLHNQLGTQLHNQLHSLNNDWYLSVWWLVWSGWYDYGQYMGVEFDKESYDLFMAFVANVGFIIPYKGIAFVSESPRAVNWSPAKRLHNQYGKAVEYADGWGLNVLDGVRLPEELWQKITDQTLSATEFAAITDVDQRAVAMKYGLPPKQFISQFEAVLVNEGEPRMYRYLEGIYGIERLMPKTYDEETNLARCMICGCTENDCNDCIERTGQACSWIENPLMNGDLCSACKPDMVTVNRLYRIDNFSVKVAKERARQDAANTKYFLHYQDPSTGKDHISFVTQFVAEVGEDADACQAKKHHYSSKKAYLMAGLEA